MVVDVREGDPREMEDGCDLTWIGGRALGV